MANEIKRIEIHHNGINAGNKVHSYEVWERNGKVVVRGIFPTLDEAKEFCFLIGYNKYQIQLNF